MNRYFSALICLLLFTVTGTTAFAQKDRVEGLWYNNEKSAKIQIYKAVNGKFYGKIVWLKEPDKNGKPKVDENNPSDSKKHTPLLGLLVLKGFNKDGEDMYEDGTIYDPKNGKTYDCKITYKGNELAIRGYIGISLIGRTTTWTRAE
jgi:uncharacterized protein (DUF2147 family)